MNTARRQHIRSYIEEKESVTVKELCALYPALSLMTIHRDLDALEKEGVIIRTHGGALSIRHLAEPYFTVRENENSSGKSVIAEKALQLVRPGSFIFLDAGSTTLQLARRMPDIEVNVFTTAPNTALELCKLQKPTISVCCGTLNRRNFAISGVTTLKMLESINIDVAFIGASGFSADSGFTCGSESEMLVKQSIIKKARTSVCLVDSDKFTKLMPYTFASIADVDYIISDAPFSDKIRSEAERSMTILL